MAGPGIPARPRGVSLGWPLVSYQVMARGPRPTPRVEVEFCLDAPLGIIRGLGPAEGAPGCRQGALRPWFL